MKNHTDEAAEPDDRLKWEIKKDKPNYQRLAETFNEWEWEIDDSGTLRKSGEKFRTFVETASDLVYIADKHGKFTYVNESMAKSLGYSKDELLSMRFDKIMCKKIPKHKIKKGIRELILKGSLYTQNIWISKDGKEIWGELNVTIDYDCEGSFSGSRGVFRDLTERRRVEKENAKLRANLLKAQKMEAIGILAGGVAHDLNNVLCGLVGFPDLLLRSIEKDSPLRNSIFKLKKSGEKAAAIVQDLLTLSRRGIITKVSLNLNKLVKEYLNSPEFDSLMTFHPGLQIVTNFEPNIYNIIGSPIHLSKTIMNLVSNAAEAQKDGGKVVITTKNVCIDRHAISYSDTIKKGEYAVFEITDYGAGISDDDMERIFEPFYSKKKMGRSGTGLGMAVVWGTIKDHNAYIDVKSIEGKETTFTLYFPRTIKELAKNKTPLPDEEYTGKGESILVVDDVKEQREIAGEILKELGYNVNTVASGEEAIDYFKRNSADLLLLDMFMDPGIDGLETYKRILELYPRQKAIIISGFSETDRVKEAIKLGAGQYIRKPYTIKSIGRAVITELTPTLHKI